MKKLVFTLLVLLAITASATAECAWVLWERQDEQLVPKYSSKTNEGCVTALQLFMKRDKEVMDKTFSRIPADKKDWPMGEVLSPIGMKMVNRIMKADYTCHPDTVDPRGPKGK